MRGRYEVHDAGGLCWEADDSLEGLREAQSRAEVCGGKVFHVTWELVYDAADEGSREV